MNLLQQADAPKMELTSHDTEEISSAYEIPSNDKIKRLQLNS